MKCPHCGSKNDKVIESRTLADGSAIRRRRECGDCSYRFTSYERIEDKPLMVVKTSGRREPFNREKLERGLQRALEKREISQLEIESILNQIEDESMILSKSSHEISSRELGEMVLKKLHDMDDVAYIRFASVYRNFESLEGFISEIKTISESAKQQKNRS
ncbi:transcriptional regulator NrdR [Salinispira pacifica]|uniref:Transcriptional repressor NrdR n=1 Tax=Salinispira pacifica TaxID=1307761 RepID=V5WHP7_9SPIO|nr:transcriptional regulator NrdR [Salinispira pacifica]AHC15049.1 Ribonucleotide reductase transcriptional regulator NrdR [Salinispira pacifica]